MTFFLLLVACGYLHPEPLVGGGVWMSDFTDSSTTGGDTGGDTGGVTDGLRLTTVVAEVTAVSQLADDEAPDDGATPVGVRLGETGPWTHLSLSGADGVTGDAWFIAGAPGLVAVGETVQISVSEGEQTNEQTSEFLLAGADGEARLWVAEVHSGSGFDTSSGFSSALDTVNFAVGDVAWSDPKRCQTERHHDFNVTDADGMFTLPLGETLVRGSDTYIHGRDFSDDNVSSAWICGMTLIVNSSRASIARVRTADFDAEALWP